ncbi:PAN domain protein [Dictyocaulus viviparus]|uniref:PAN domain protein n=1 Tax=Dictyocaulus viviparus TaxID=29172 RepID=A0A0D8XEJ7_DICVI|nr:PAN domain protein [Dictyocaulus viviparus]
MLRQHVTSRSEITCAPALQPSIGTVYFVPREECFEVSKQTAHARYAVLRQLDGANDKNKPPLRDPFSSIAVEVLPIVPDCPLGEKARVQIIDGVEVISSSAVPVSFKVESAAKCVHACITSTFSDASRLPLLCRSAHFNRLSTKCSIYSDAINPNGYLEYRPNSNVLYMEKLCISGRLKMILPLSCDEVFRRIPQHILLGHASDIITSTSEEECIRECIAAKVNRGIQCQSLLHYPDEPVENCILNVHSKLTRPKYFIPELEHKVDYVEIPDCAKNLVNEDLDTMNSEGRVIDRNKNWGFPPGLGIVEYEWSEWTDCDRQTSTQRRERLCSDCIERIQIQPCFSNFDQQLTTIIDDQEKVGPPAIPPHSNSIEAQSILPLIPFPERSAMNSLTFNKNKTMNVEFFGPAFDDLGAAWKSTFKTT